MSQILKTALDKDICAKLATLGIGPGKTFNFKDLSLEHKAAVLLTTKTGSDKVDAAIANGGKDQNGWRVGGLSGDDCAYFNGNWLNRAGLAKAGIFANDPAKAMYPATRKDTDGETIDTSKHSYTLTFPADQRLLVGDDV